MAVDIFMKIEGVKGEAKDAKHKNEIDVLSWSWGVANSGSFHVAGGGGTGKASMRDLTFTKEFDAASADLQLFCATGKHIPKAILVMRVAGEKPHEYIIIELSKCLISSVELSSSTGGGDNRGVEAVTLNFEEIYYKYVPQTDAGGAGTAMQYKFNIAENVNK
jgi:type VI secretion system secreted protein Hcp